MALCPLFFSTYGLFQWLCVVPLVTWEMFMLIVLATDPYWCLLQHRFCLHKSHRREARSKESFFFKWIKEKFSLTSSKPGKDTPKVASVCNTSN